MKKFLMALAISSAAILLSPTANAGVYAENYGGQYKVHLGGGYQLNLTPSYKDENGVQHYNWTLYGPWWPDGGPYGSINPNPEEGGGNEETDWDAAMNLAKQKGGKLKMTPAFAKTPLGKLLTGKGVGIVPVYQPGVDGDENGPSTGGSPSDNFDWIMEKMKDQANKVGGHVGELEFQPNSGGVKEHVKKSAKKGKKNDDNGDPDKKTGVAQGGFWGDLPGPPELVNPNPVARSRTPNANQPSAAIMGLPSAGGGAKAAPAGGMGLAGPRR